MEFGKGLGVEGFTEGTSSSSVGNFLGKLP
jgi:hypothetical protein